MTLINFVYLVERFTRYRRRVSASPDVDEEAPRPLAAVFRGVIDEDVEALVQVPGAALGARGPVAEVVADVHPLIGDGAGLRSGISNSI